MWMSPITFRCHLPYALLDYTVQDIHEEARQACPCSRSLAGASSSSSMWVGIGLEADTPADTPTWEITLI